MDYIYIFTNSAFPEYVLIGESSDCNKSLELLNDLNTVPIPFEIFLTYQKPYSYFSLDLYFHPFSVGLSVFPIDATYYKITKEDSYKYLLDIARHLGNEKDLLLFGQLENKNTAMESGPKDEHGTVSSNPGKPSKSNSNASSGIYTKNYFIEFFTNLGYTLFPNITYSSLVKSGDYYWPSPLSHYFKEDWSLILNDNLKKQVHLFNIKAHSIPLSKMKMRTDEKHQGVVFMKISNHDPDYTEPNSGIKFKPYLVATIDYSGNATATISENKVEYTTNSGLHHTYSTTSKTASNTTLAPSSAIIKKMIIKYLEELGYVIHNCVSLASLNKNGLLYWSNPPVIYLNNDWTFIINEKKLRKIYLFEIKANTLSSSQFKIRNDNFHHGAIDLEIKRQNSQFIDSSSKINFSQFLIAEIDYNEELNKIANSDEELNDSDGDSLGKSDSAVNQEHSKESNTHICDLNSLINICYSTVPVSFSFLGNKYSANHWSEVITVVMECLYNYDPISLRKLAHSKSFSKFLCVNKILNNGEIADDGFKEIYNSGIYYYNDIDGAYDSRFLDFKKCILKLGFTGDDLQFEYKYDDSDYIARHNDLKTLIKNIDSTYK